jgi:hypothetical protein
MKMKLLLSIQVALLALIGLTACQKSMDPVVPTIPDEPGIPVVPTIPEHSDTTSIPYPQTVLRKCEGAPDYGDSIIFMQPAANEFIVYPINHPDSGQYFSWPEGMSLDRNTGAINVSRSDGGLRYNIGYVKNGTTDTCLQTIILAGVSYADSIYVLNDDERYAKPYYNADPNLVSICSGSGVPGGSTCEYDINGAAASQFIKVDNNNGFIDLKNTLNDGAFGLLPTNGTTIKTTIAYRLNDNSNMATQYIPVTLVYYNKKSDVPADLLNLITQKLDKILEQVLLIDLFNSGSSISKNKPRPPIIVVTRYK